MTSTSIEFFIMQPIEEGKKFAAEYSVTSFKHVNEDRKELAAALQYLDTVEFIVLSFIYLYNRPVNVSVGSPYSFLYPIVERILPSLPSHSSTTPLKQRGTKRKRANDTDGNKKPSKKPNNNNNQEETTKAELRKALAHICSSHSIHGQDKQLTLVMPEDQYKRDSLPFCSAQCLRLYWKNE